MAKGQNFSLPVRGTELHSSLPWDRNLLFIKGQSFILHCKVTEIYCSLQWDRAFFPIAKGQSCIVHCKGTELCFLCCKGTELHSSLQRDRALFLTAVRQSYILHCKWTALFFITLDRGMTVNQFLAVSSSSGSCCCYCSCCQHREDCSNIRSKRSFVSWYFMLEKFVCSWVKKKCTRSDDFHCAGTLWHRCADQGMGTTEDGHPQSTRHRALSGSGQ